MITVWFQYPQSPSLQEEKGVDLIPAHMLLQRKQTLMPYLADNLTRAVGTIFLSHCHYPSDASLLSVRLYVRSCLTSPFYLLPFIASWKLLSSGGQVSLCDYCFLQGLKRC